MPPLGYDSRGAFLPSLIAHTALAPLLAGQADFKASFETATEAVKELPALLQQNRTQEDLTPLKVLTLFKRVPDSVGLVPMALKV